VILAVAAIYTQEHRLVWRGWYALHILIYPTNAQASASTAEYKVSEMAASLELTVVSEQAEWEINWMMLD